MGHRVQVSLLDENGIVLRSSVNEFDIKQDAENVFEDTTNDIEGANGGTYRRSW